VSEGRLGIGIRVKGEGTSLSFPVGVLDEKDSVGIFHTHSFADTATGQAFSWPDFQFFFRTKLRIMIVQSGDYRFLIGKPLGFRVPGQTEEVDLEIAFGKWLATSWTAEAITEQQALLQANLKLCSRTGLCFYYGDGRLRRLVPA
jgi:hypothetical protein